MKVLLTGFEPFENEPINPAFEAIKIMPDEILEAEIIKVEIPVVFHESITVLVDAIELYKPDIVICVGQAGGRFQICPERIAVNNDDARIPDNKNNKPVDTPIFNDGENAYFSKLPIKAIVSEIKDAGIPSAVSNTAGSFVCNHLMYGLLYHLNKNPKYENIKGGFIHVPYVTSQVVDKPDKPSLSLGTISRAIELAVEATIKNDNDILMSDGTTH